MGDGARRLGERCRRDALAPLRWLLRLGERSPRSRDGPSALTFPLTPPPSPLLQVVELADVSTDGSLEASEIVLFLKQLVLHATAAPAGRDGKRGWARKWPRRADGADEAARFVLALGARHGLQPAAARSFRRGSQLGGKGNRRSSAKEDEGLLGDATSQQTLRTMLGILGGEREGGTCAPARLDKLRAALATDDLEMLATEGADLPADALDDGALAFALLHAADRDGDGRLGLDDLQVYCAALLAADAEGKGGGGRRGSKARSKAKDGGAEEVSTTPETEKAAKGSGKRRQSAKKLFSGVDLGAK